jgi:hypothetical protein
MSKRELERMMAAFARTRERNNTKEKSLAFLERAGILTAEGELTEPYRELAEQ